MPTVRYHLSRNQHPQLTSYQLAVLLDQEPPEPTDADTWWEIVEAGCDRPTLAYYSTSIKALWLRNEAALLAAWIVDNPGARPSAWWSYSAPRAPAGSLAAAVGMWLDGQLPEPRRRLGGKGTPRHEALAYVPTFWCGMPDRWLTVEDLRIWPKLMAEPYDPADPPVYEAQAEYLRRHDLLLPGERRRLRKRHFEAEAATLE